MLAKETDGFCAWIHAYPYYIDELGVIKLEFHVAGGFILMIVWTMTRYLMWSWSIFEGRLLLYNEKILKFS